MSCYSRDYSTKHHLCRMLPQEQHWWGATLADERIQRNMNPSGAFRPFQAFPAPLSLVPVSKTGIIHSKLNSTEQVLIILIKLLAA